MGKYMYNNHAVIEDFLNTWDISAGVYLILDTLWLEPDDIEDHVITQTKITADYYSGLDYAQSTDQIDTRWIVSLEDIKKSITKAIDAKLIFSITQKELRMIDQLHTLCGIEYTATSPREGDLSLTPVGVSIMRRIGTRIRENIRKNFSYMVNEEFSDETKVRFTLGMKFYHPYQEQGQDSHPTILIAPTRDNLLREIKELEDVNIPDDEIFSIGAWCDKWWDIYYGGFGCQVCWN